MNPTDIEKLKAEHGPLAELQHDGESVIVKSPTRATWKRFRAQMVDESKRIIAMEELVRGCVVHPERAEVEAMLERRPGLAETFGKLLSEMAGASDKGEKKAL